MKRVAVSGSDRHPDGAEYLMYAGEAGRDEVQVGERIIVFLADEPHIEADAVVEFHPGWGLGWFGLRSSEWRNTQE